MNDFGSIIVIILALLGVAGQIIRAIRGDSEENKQKALRQNARRQRVNRNAPQPMQQELIEDERVSEVKPFRSKRARQLLDQSATVIRQWNVDVQPTKKPHRLFEDATPSSSRRQALTKKLPPQGEGQRFSVEPGTLDTDRIVSPSIDPSVKPELASITGIYEDEAATMIKGRTSDMTFNFADWLAKPESIFQAVIFAEIINRPDWEKRRL